MACDVTDIIIIIILNFDVIYKYLHLLMNLQLLQFKKWFNQSQMTFKVFYVKVHMYAIKLQMLEQSSLFHIRT